MKKNTPLKRHPALHHLSHDHHQGLLVCWKIRQGFKLKIDPVRVKNYCMWFWKNHLQQHFEEEENGIFPVISSGDPLIKQALSEHKRLRKLFGNWEDIEKTLGQIEEGLEKHIRFEERVLFPIIQKKATKEQLDAISKYGKKEKFTDNNNDPFWISSQG